MNIIVLNKEVRIAQDNETVAFATARGVEVILWQRKDCAQLAALRDRYLRRLTSFHVEKADPRISDAIHKCSRQSRRRAIDLSEKFKATGIGTASVPSSVDANELASD